MTNTENAIGSKERVGIEKRFELAEGYVKTVLSLSTGALVLSVTFLHDVIGITPPQDARRIVCRGLILGSWVAFMVGAVGSLFYLYHLAIASKYEDAYARELKWGAIVSSSGLAVGLVLLSSFAWANLP